MQSAREIDRIGAIDGTGDRPVARPPAGPGDDGLSRRASTAEDHDFLLALFADSRPELSLLPDGVRADLIRLQFDSQLSQCRSSAPDGVDWILEVDRNGHADPVGRCYVQQGADEHRLLDLAIRSRWRGHGFGSRVLAGLCDDAARAGVPLRLTAWAANHDALRLYRRLGFVADPSGSGAGGRAPEPAGYLPLRWSAGGAR